MAKTENFELKMPDDGSQYFGEFWKELSDSSGSNMTEIDKLLGEMAIQSQSLSAVLESAQWIGAKAPYTQTVLIEDLLYTHNGTIALSQEATEEERTEVRKAMLSVVGQANGSLVIAADGEVPTIDLPVTVMLLG